MGFSKQLVIVLGVVLVATQAVSAYDPTITSDYGIPNATSGNDFTFTGFRPANLPAPTPGLILVPALAAQFPGVQGLGTSALYFLVGDGAEVPPHSHPRATETFFVISGTWSVGFVDTTNKLFSNTLYPGDIFIFPIGLLHYQLVTEGPGTGISVFNSQNPGVALTAPSLFASTPLIPTEVLTKGFMTTDACVLGIENALAPPS